MQHAPINDPAKGDRSKKMGTPVARREAVAQLRVAFDVS
jgi:hypothetical protein